MIRRGAQRTYCLAWTRAEPERPLRNATASSSVGQTPSWPKNFGPSAVQIRWSILRLEAQVPRFSIFGCPLSLGHCPILQVLVPSRLARALTASSGVVTVIRAQKLHTDLGVSCNTRVRRSPLDWRTNSTLTIGPLDCQSPTSFPSVSAQRAQDEIFLRVLSFSTGSPPRFQTSEPHPRHTIMPLFYIR